MATINLPAVQYPKVGEVWILKKAFAFRVGVYDKIIISQVFDTWVYFLGMDGTRGGGMISDLSDYYEKIA